ncbi:MAG: PilZ domain-containing protein [Planctomycetota bacterium]
MERRQFPRLQDGWALDFTVLEDGHFEGEPVSASTVNVSGGGLCIETHDAVEPGTLLAIELRSPAADDPLRALARVVWCRPEEPGGPFQIGVEFCWVGWFDDDVEPEIASYVQQALAHDDADR